MSYNLSWGHSVAVRKAFVETYHQNPIQFGPNELMKLDYPDHDGDKELIKITKDVIKRQIDKDYNHVFMVNGATGGVVIALRAFQQKGAHFCYTRKAPFYVRYPRMIKTAGLVQMEELEWQTATDAGVVLLDFPSNPLGSTTTVGPLLGASVILDGVYYNKVYTNGNIPCPNHDVLVGSYSKLLGLNGIRSGWIATNDDLLAERIKDLVASEYCGLSSPSDDILKHALQGFNWGKFESLAHIYLDNNRYEWSKLEKFFSGWKVSPIGMFHYTRIDPTCKKLLDKAGISYVPGSQVGTDDSFGRFNIGQNNDLIKQAVKAVLKADKINR